MSQSPSLIRVDLAERGYDIEVADDSLLGLGAFMRDRRPMTHVVVITDTNVEPLHADRAADALVEEGLEVHLMVVDAGEASKSAEVAFELWETMLEEGVDRQSVVVAIGGGVVGDLAGFVAATFARGLDFFQAPTTLLAQVDSSVGGKVGINLPGAKNMVGAFWQPQGVLIDIQTLKTLPDREYRAGLAEVVKHGVILDAEFFAFLEANVEAIHQRDANALRHIVTRCCRIKADVVEQDERESGIRSILNYGHTFCHALEAATGYSQLLHGEGVAIGMIAASRLAERRGLLPATATQRQITLLEALGLSIQTPDSLSVEDLIPLMWRDKKVKDGRIRFILPTAIGKVEMVDDVSPQDIESALA